MFAALSIISWLVICGNSITIKRKGGEKENNNNKIRIQNNSDYYIAVDIGKRTCVVCITNKDGSILEETKYNNTLQEAERFASHLNKKYDNKKCQTVCESTANMWLKTYEAFEKNGIDVNWLIL